MSGTFTWIPDKLPTKSVKPAVDEAKFGDGYAQRVGQGINRSPQSWRLAFTLRTKAQIDQIDDFLLDHDNGSSFTWTTPRGNTGLFVCKAWDATYDHDGNAALTATFDQVYE